MRLEFADRIIGESAKVECSADQESEVNYSTSLPISSEDAVLIDEMASRPLLCTLTLPLLLGLFVYRFVKSATANFLFLFSTQTLLC